MAFLYLIDIVIYFLVAGAFFNLARKADLNGIAWFAFIPILSTILQLRMIKKSGWWILIMLVPIVNIVFAIIWQVKLLQAFGKSGHYAWFLLISIVYAILWMVWGYSKETTYRLNGNGNPPMNTVGA